MAPRNTLSDDQLVMLVKSLTNAGERDGLGGGVPAEKVAAQTEYVPSTIGTRLSNIARDTGRLVQVQGVPLERGKNPRPSYLPADHPDAQPGDEKAQRGWTP